MASSSSIQEGVSLEPGPKGRTCGESHQLLFHAGRTLEARCSRHGRSKVIADVRVASGTVRTGALKGVGCQEVLLSLLDFGFFLSRMVVSKGDLCHLLQC